MKYLILILKLILPNFLKPKIKVLFYVIKIKLINLLNLLKIYRFSKPYNPENDEKYLNYKDEGIINLYENIDLKFGGKYFEAGGLDGYFGSPTFFLYAKYKWNGVIVEPNEKYLYQIRLFRPKDKIFSTLLVSPEELVKNKEYDFLDLHHSSSILKDKNMDEWSIEQYKKNPNIKVSKVMANTIDNLFNENNINTKFDLFVLDLEGHEYEALKGVNFEKCDINYFLIELREFNKKDVFSLMQKNNYKFIGRTSKQDHLFKKNITNC